MPSRISTNRLVLRPFRAQDAEAVLRALTEYDVAKWLGRVPFPYKRADAQAYVEVASREFPQVVAITLDDEVIGSLDIKGDSLGYWIAKPQWGKGLMTEAARAMVGRYFDVTRNDTLGAGYFVGNAASARVLEKLGFLPLAEETLLCVAQDKVLPHQMVQLTRSAWMAS